MSGESPQPIIWNIYKPSGNIGALKKKKKRKRNEVVESQSTVIDSAGEAAFLRGQHLNRAGRAGAKEAGNWGRRAAVIANSLC